jgi:hypothetical protein
MTKPREKGNILRGLPPLKERINVRDELKHLRVDPLLPFLTHITKPSGLNNPFQLDDASSYHLAYEFHYRCLARFLPEMSLFVRWANGPYYTRRLGGKYTPTEAKLASKFRAIDPYIELDYTNCLIHARLLMDRVARLSRTFLSGAELPSDTSFTAHRNFFMERHSPYGDHELYAERIRSKTDWYDGLVEIRDKYIVHPGHMPFLQMRGILADSSELTMIWRPPIRPKEPSRVDVIMMSVPRLAREIDSFLRWFNDYGLRARARADWSAGSRAAR